MSLSSGALRIGSKPWFGVAAFFAAITMTHGLLDAMTDGGLGVGFFIPFSAERYFLPWTPIEVSPIGVKQFFSARGMAVIRSELLFVWVPVLAALAGSKGLQRAWSRR